MNRALRNALLDGPKQTGTYDPKKILPVIEEHLTDHEYILVGGFLNWVWENDLSYGSEGIERMWQQYLELGGDLK